MKVRNLTSEEVNRLRDAIREHDLAHERLNSLVHALGIALEQEFQPNQQLVWPGGAFVTLQDQEKEP